MSLREMFLEKEPQNWKKIFESSIQSAIVECALTTYVRQLKFLYTENLVSESTFREQSEAVAFILGKDLTNLLRFFRTRLPREGEFSDRDLKGIFQAVFFESKNLIPQPKKLDLESRMRKLIECETTLLTLKEARNVYAHEVSFDRSAAWNQMVTGAAIYFFEIADVPDKYNTLINELIDTSFSSQKKMDESSVANPRDKDKEAVGASESLDSLLSDVAEIKNIINRQGGGAFPDENDLELISEAQLELELHIIREKINDKYGGSNWPGPMANLCQRSIINQILEFKPRDLETALRLPDVAWRVHKNAYLIKLQVNIFGDEINNMLKITDWEVVDESPF